MALQILSGTPQQFFLTIGIPEWQIGGTNRKFGKNGG